MASFSKMGLPIPVVLPRLECCSLVPRPLPLFGGGSGLGTRLGALLLLEQRLPYDLTPEEVRQEAGPDVI